MDWASCEQEVVRLYVDEAKTIHETLQYLHEKHGITATPKQFKSKFGGLKNLRADEWKVVIRKIRERKDQGKASDVYLNGRKLKPERVLREIRRYSKECNDDNQAENCSSIDLGVDSPNPHRIEIRTPTSPKVDPPLHGNLDISHRRIENLEARPSQDVDRPIELIDVELVPISEFDIDFMDLDFSTPRIPAKSPRYSISDSPRLLSSHSPSAQYSDIVSYPLGATRPSTAITMLTCPSQPSLPFRNRTPPVSHTSTASVSSLALYGVYGRQDSSLKFFWDLPDISSFIPVSGATSTLMLDTELCIMNWGQKYKRVPRGTKGWLLPHLVGVDRKLEALQPVANYVEKLLLRFPTADMDTQLFHSASQQSLCQMFAVFAYLASNNFIESYQMLNFLIWVSAMGYLGQLSRFLQIESANVYAFRASLLRACVCRSSFQTPAGIRRAEIQQSEALPLLLSLDHRICSSRLGGELLHEISDSNRTYEAELLVLHGADINFVRNIAYPGFYLGTPLCRAIILGANSMVKYLISAGCDVNKRFRNASDGEETALTIAIRADQFDMVTDLLNAGAKVDNDLRIEGFSILEFVKMRSPRTYKLLQEKLGPGEIPEVLQLIGEAEKGNRPLSRFLLKHNILHEEALEWALCQAAKLGSRGAVRTLLQRGIDPNARRSRLIDGTIEDTPPILLALTASERTVASDNFYLLMKAGAEIDDDILMRICCSVIDKGHVNIVRMLAEAGYKAALFWPSILEYTAYAGEIYACGFFLDIGAPINAYGMKGRSCLQVAAGKGNLLLVQYLIDRGADVNLPACDDGGLTALQGAAQGGHREVVDYLIDTGAEVRAAPAKNRGVTVLEAAAGVKNGEKDEKFEEREKELVSTFKSLLALGALVNRTNGTSGTVLHRLIRTSRIECVKLALQAGAQIEDRETSRSMSTPLQVAVTKGDMEAIQLLLEHGADVNAPAGAEFGRTTLQAATSADEPDPDIIELLLLYGADINAPPAARGGVTALQGAAIQGDLQTVRMLLAHDADVNAPPAQEGRTAVEGAAEHGRMEVMRLLLSAGAKADPVLGFLRAIELAEENGHLALADLLREYDRATRLQDTVT